MPDDVSLEFDGHSCRVNKATLTSMRTIEDEAEAITVDIDGKPNADFKAWERTPSPKDRPQLTC